RDRVARRRRRDAAAAVQDAPAPSGQGRQRAAEAPDRDVRGARHPPVRALTSRAGASRPDIPSKTLMVDSPVMRKTRIARGGVMARGITISMVAVISTVFTSATVSAQSGTSASNFSVPVVYRSLPNGLKVVVRGKHAAPGVGGEGVVRVGMPYEAENPHGL